MFLPVTTGSISSPMGRGSDSTPVKVNIQGVDTYLADSMQFLLEYGCRFNPKGVYYLMPSFRGELADERHLCQFYHSEAEIRGDLEDIIKLVESYIKYLARRIIKTLGNELIEIMGDISHIKKVANRKSGFKRLTFDEAENILIKKFGKKYIENYIQYFDGWRNITKLAEKELINLYGGVVWITNYDKLAVPFYQKDSDDGKTVKNADLLMGIGETVGCGERHDNALDLHNALDSHGVDSKEYNWYIKLKDKFPMQTAGFGMGTERFLMWVLKGKDIRNYMLCLRFNGEDLLP